MWTRISAIISNFDLPGVVPKALQVFAALLGVAVIGVAVAVFVSQAWNGEVTEGSILYTALILLTGLAMLRSGVKPTNEDRKNDD